MELKLLSNGKSSLKTIEVWKRGAMKSSQTLAAMSSTKNTSLLVHLVLNETMCANK